MADAEAAVTVQETEAETQRHSKGFFTHTRGRTRERLKRLRKLLPRPNKQKLEAPVNTLLSLVCDLGCLSFRAYNDPSVEGFGELTTTGCRVKHLNYDILNHSVEGVLKIHLQRARNVLDADVQHTLISEFGPGRSDPYVVFSAGWSQTASATVKDAEHPVWNSTHYLTLRKPGAVQRDDEKLNIRLFDSDVSWGDNAERVFRQFLIRDDFLGSASIDIADLKTPGLHKREVTLHLEGDHREQKTVVIFTCQFLTFAEACMELHKEEDSGVWSRELEDRGDCKWTELPVDTHVGHITFEPIAFINCMRTGTQVWIHVNRDEKAVAIAFRGTEANRLKDLLTDLNFLPSRLKWCNDGTCKLRLTDNVTHKRIRVHSGFKGAYKSVWSTLLTLVEDVCKWGKDWTICVTGHSLGGALATLCAFEYANRQNESGETPHVVMMNFGAPRLGNAEFTRHYRITVPESYRVVNRLDIIHKIPIFLKHVNREMAFEEDGEVIVDKRIHISVETQPLDEEEDSEETPVPKTEKLSRRALFKAPGFQGHFENYYFNVVTRAIMSIFQNQKDQMQYLLGGLHAHTEAEAAQEQDQEAGTSKMTTEATAPVS